MKVLITTVPFADKDQAPLRQLKASGIEYLINPLNRKLTEKELAKMVKDFDVIIAGTEIISDYVMSCAPRLKMISRVGIGLDSVDLVAARKRGIKVSYTPEAPAPAVAEITMGMILTLLRFIHLSNTKMHQGDWCRYFGRRLSKCTIGIIGVGRIGRGVIKHLEGFSTVRVLANDMIPCHSLKTTLNIEWVDKEIIYKESDVITLHLPLTTTTKDLIKECELNLMKQDAILINTSRGGIVNEADLYKVMKNGHLSGAAIDVFNKEPYEGNLSQIDRCLLTSHMGSMSVDCRNEMEVKATDEAVRFLKGKSLDSEVPEVEYNAQYEGW